MKSLLVAALLLLSGSTTYADIIPSLAGAPALITSGIYAGDWAWTYSISLAGDQQLAPSSGFVAGAAQTWPNFFTIFDFGSPTAVPLSAPAGWTGSAADPNATHAFLQNAPNQAAISDIQIDYAGSAAITGPETICCFTFVATTNQEALGWYEGQGTKFDPNNQADATEQGNVGRVLVPFSSSGNLQETPEPATFALLGFGIAGLAGLALLRRSRT